MYSQCSLYPLGEKMREKLRLAVAVLGAFLFATGCGSDPGGVFLDAGHPDLLDATTEPVDGTVVGDDMASGDDMTGGDDMTSADDLTVTAPDLLEVVDGTVIPPDLLFV